MSVVVEALRADVAVLYVDPRGPYPSLVANWWDETRRAETYAGPAPIVAHPPCGPYSVLRRWCTKQDARLAPIAVAQVRRWGGVLEHPAHSKLWAIPGLRMPRPGELPDEFGGVTIEVDQVSWGHKARKRTWLYLCRVDRSFVARTVRKGGTPTHVVARSHRASSPLPSMSSKARRCSPVEFARWLVQIASTVQ